MFTEIIFQDLNREKFYFAHSYYVDCDEKYIYAYCDYKIKFPAIVKSGNIYGIQFHPEKSNVNGLKLLKKYYQRTSNDFEKNNPVFINNKRR